MRNTFTQNLWLRAKLTQISAMGLPWMAASLTGATAFSAIVLTVPAQAAILSSWEYNPSNYELEILVPGGTTPRYSLVAEPARIIIDLPNTTIGTVSQQQTYGGAIREIRVAQHEPGLTRIVLELAPGTVLAPGHVELRQVGTSGSGQSGDRWILRPLLVTDSPTPTATAPLPSAPPAPQPSATPRADSSPDSLPPLEPGALEIPVELPPAEPIAQSQPPPLEPPLEPEAELEPETASAEQDSSPSEADRTYGGMTQPDEEVPSATVTVPEPPAEAEMAIEPEPEPEPDAEPELDAEPESTEEPIAEPVEEPSSANVVSLPDLQIEAVLPDAPSLDAESGSDISGSDISESQEATPEVVEPPTVEPPTVSEPPAVSQPPASIAQPPSQSIVQPQEGLPALPPATSLGNAPAMVNVPPLEEEAATGEAAPEEAASEESPNEEVATEEATEELPNEEPPTATQPTPEAPAAPPATDPSTANVPVPDATVNRLADNADNADDADDVPAVESTPAESLPNSDRAPIQVAPPAPAAPTADRLIEFGQPLTAVNPAPSVSAPALPPASPLQPNATIVSGEVLLPVGTVLSLRYPGTAPLELVEGQSRQEVLVLAASVQNAAGNVILPEGSQVIGRFETQAGRSQFVTQAIAVQGRNVLLNAESGNLLSESTSNNRSLQNSAIGGTAEAVGDDMTGVELVPTIAAGGTISTGGTINTAPPTVTTNVSAASSTVIQPNQVFEVQLTEDLPQIN